MKVESFKVNIAQEVLDDLRERLRETRWTDEVKGAEWEYGANAAYIKELVDYWRDEYDWRAQEKAINQFAHFRADIDGIHFIHERGKGENPMPLIVTHGWPSSFWQMLKILPMLTDPAAYGGDAADSFDVIAPSLPGYGFSDRPKKAGMNSARVAELWARLMTEALGYPRFAAHAGDIGGSVTQRLAAAHPDLLIGIHLTDIGWAFGSDLPDLSEAESKFLQDLQEWSMQEGAYAMIQSTKPQTLAYGLNDSPAGLAAWIVEKFRAWSDNNGDVEQRFSKDELLTNLTIYWVTETVNSSIRIYYEDQHNPPPPGQRIEVPAGVALFPKDITHPPRELAERFLNVQRWTPMKAGGHFPALEEPEALVEDIRAFFRPFRD